MDGRGDATTEIARPTRARVGLFTALPSVDEFQDEDEFASGDGFSCASG